jgi:hypothetical protein
MKSGVAMLLGAGALLCFAAIADNANAAARHHGTRLHYRAPSSASAEATDLSISGNNPAKRAKARSVSENAVTGATLMQSGNNPAKRYAVRHSPDNAAAQPTLMTNGNNPAKRAPGASHETTGAGATSRR